MVSGSYLFSFSGLWPFLLPIRLNLGIFGSEQDNDPELFPLKCNGRIYLSILIRKTLLACFVLIYWFIQFFDDWSLI